MANEHLIKPDLKFIRQIVKGGGDSLKKCFQCATCSVTCSLSPSDKPFPRKEMIWTSWGLKKKLLANPDIWLCHQCGDCTAYCPRGAKPSEVLSAVRKMVISHYSFPSFLAKIAEKPRFLPFLFLIPALLLGLALLAKDSIESHFGFSKAVTQRIIYPSTPIFPHWLLNSLFLSFGFFVFISAFVSIIRFWGAMKKTEGNINKAKGLCGSILSALKDIITHDKFLQCTTNKARFLSHACIFFGFIALSVVTIWVITLSINPLLKGFAYPFNFFNPLKIIANLGGLFLVAGCCLMISNRLSNSQKETTGTYFDWVFILVLLSVAITGFATELLHYMRVDEPRYIAYFIHLVCVSVLLLYLPYSKFAHILYRTTAMVYSKYYGREK